MADIYSAGERALIFVIIAVVSIASSLICLIRLVDRKKVSWYIFIICLVYSSLFVFLNIISMFDLIFSGQKGFTNFSKFISNFYTVFDYIDKALGFFIFPWMIYYLESGQQTIGKKILDGLYGIAYEFLEPLVLSFRIILCIVIIVILIVYRKHYELGKNPLDYIFVVLDCYAIIDIYMCVGFFMVQIFIDFRTQRDSKLSDNYYKYSTIKIINKTESYLKKMIELSEKLSESIQNYNKDKSSSEFMLLKELFQNVDEKVKQYELESNFIIPNNNLNSNNYNHNMNFNNYNNNMNLNYNNNLNINYNNNLNFYNYNNNMNFNHNNNMFINYNSNIQQPNYVDVFNNYNNINTEHNLNNNIEQNNNNIQSDRKEKLKIEQDKAQNVEVKDNEIDKEKEKKEDLSPVECNKKYKKYIRRIDKLKMLFKEIEKENKSRRFNNKKCHWYNIVFFIAFSIAIVTDFLLPIVLDSDKNESDRSEYSDGEHEKEKSTLSLGVSIVISIAFAVITSPYTLITIYTTIRRKYISGDFLYNKQINDNLSLIKTVQLICGFSFSVIFCNLFFWRTIDTSGSLYGKPNIYETIIIPDYRLKAGISILMIIKIIIIIISIISAFLVTKLSVFKNDLGGFNLKHICNRRYDYSFEFNKVLMEKKKIYSFLNSITNN